MKIKIRLLLFAFSTVKLCAQVGIGTTAPVNNAALEIRDTTKGILIPRMSMSNRNNIINPSEALMIYQTDGLKGFWYFDGVQWKNINTLNNVGKQTIILSDNITNAEAQAKIVADFGPNTQEIKIVGCSMLTNIDLSMITNTISINISDNTVLQNINLDNLVSCSGIFAITNCPLLTTLTLSSLESVLSTEFDYDGLYIKNTGITNLNFSLLRKLTGSIYISENNKLTSISFPKLTSTNYPIEIYNNNYLTSISFATLTNVKYVSINNNQILSSFSIPLVTTIEDLYLSSNNALTSISFPALTELLGTLGGVNIYSQNLTSISLNNLTTFNNSSFYVSGKLPSSQVNYLLNKFVSISPTLTGKNFNFNQFPAAPPTGQGISDKATLIARGNNVITD